MTFKTHAGVCMVLIRKRSDYKFFSTSFTLDLGSTKQSLRGKLAPGGSDRSFVLLINPGVGRSDILAALKKAAEFIHNTKPGCVDTVVVSTGKKVIPALAVAAVVVNEAETLPIDSRQQLKKPLATLPYSIVYAPASLRHWQDAYDDLRAVTEEIEVGDLPRGFITTPLGMLTVREGEDELYAEIGPTSSYRRSRRFSKPRIEDGYFFGNEEDEDEDESEN